MNTHVNRPTGGRIFRGPPGIFALAFATAFAMWSGRESAGAEGLPAPWGKLETSVVYLDPPSEVVKMQDLPSFRPEWHFGELTPVECLQLLRSAGVPEARMEAAMDRSRWFEDPGRVRWFPPEEFVINLDPRVRAVLYRDLARFEGNRLMRQPFLFEDGDIEGRFRGTGFSGQLVGFIRTLCYSQGNSLAFADLGLCLNHFTSAAEERGLVRVLSRSRTLMVRVKAETEADLDPLVDYWSAGGRNPGAMAFLEGLIRSGGGIDVDLSYLLPPLARRNVHRFPAFPDGMNGRFPDALGAALNFHQVIERELDFASPDIDGWVRQRFDPVDEPYVYGDLLFVVRELDRRAVHACIHLADDLVYVKNGTGVMHPWVISRLSTVMDVHWGGQRVLVSGWRPKR